MTTKHQFNKRKNALARMIKLMEKEGYEFKKCMKNTVVFRHLETGKKIRETLVYD
jgi:hypothetical protein